MGEVPHPVTHSTPLRTMRPICYSTAYKRIYYGTVFFCSAASCVRVRARVEPSLYLVLSLRAESINIFFLLYFRGRRLSKSRRILFYAAEHEHCIGELTLGSRQRLSRFTVPRNQNF